jgi:hypothetical protein
MERDVTRRTATQTDPFQANPLGRGQLPDFRCCSLLACRISFAPAVRTQIGRRAKLVRDARCYRQSASDRLEKSQLIRQPPDGMPPTYDSMH